MIKFNILFNKNEKILHLTIERNNVILLINQ